MPVFSPAQVRAMAHKQCNAWCKGDTHAVIVGHQDGDTTPIHEVMEGAALEIGGELIDFRPAPEAQPTEPPFTADGFAEQWPTRFYVCIFRWTE